MSARVWLSHCILGLTLLPAWPLIVCAEQLAIRTYTTADGLARDQINRIVRDPHGFLWFCTPEGLSRFDGYRFTNYAIADGLPHRSVRDLLVTRDGTYWIATGDGVCLFNPNGARRSPREAVRRREADGTPSPPMFTAYRPDESEAAHGITRLLEDHTGVIWCGTFGGLYRMRKSNGQVRFDSVDLGMTSETMDDQIVEAILEDRRGCLWIGTRGSGIYCRFPEGQVQHYTTLQGLPWNRVNALLEARDGRVWVGTTWGLCVVLPGRAPNQPVVDRVYTTRDGLINDWVETLIQSADGSLWIGTARGLSRLDLSPADRGPVFRGYTTAQGLSDVGITALAEDGQDNLWIGTSLGGAMKLGLNGFVSYGDRDGLSTGVASIFEDQAGELCVFGKGPLYRFDGERFRAIRPRYPEHITYFGWGSYQLALQDRMGEWWISTGQGLCRFPRADRVERLKRLRPVAVYTTRDGLAGDIVFRLYEDSRGDIWIGTVSAKLRYGLTRWDRTTGAFHNYTVAEGWTEGAWVQAFREDADGNLWIGTDRGLARYRPRRAGTAGQFTFFTTADGLPANSIGALHLDHLGSLWLATNQGGAARLENASADRPRFKTYAMAEGLSSNQTHCITEDVWGRIYIGTGRGLDRLDPATGQFRHYTASDGLRTGGVHLAYRDREGTLWFVSQDMLARFIPKPDEKRAAPPILIGGVRIGGVPLQMSELGESNIHSLVLGPSENRIELDFSGLNFEAGEVLKYQYDLEGTGQDWSPPSDQRTVNFAELPPGQYRFLVRLRTADGLQSTSPATMSFTILPPIWRRNWFLALAAALAGWLIYSMHRARLSRLLQLERVRTRIATDLHDDIGASLSQIAILSEVARQRVPPSADGLSEPLSQIARVSGDLVDSMSDIVWSINPKRDRLSDLTQRMRRFASDVLTARDIRFQLRMPPLERNMKLAPDLRRQVFLVFKESINNMIRHSRCTQADIEFSVENDGLQLRLADNGCGFDPSEAGDGHGLVSMRARARALGGSLSLESSPGQGTTVVLRVPLGEQPLIRWNRILPD